MANSKEIDQILSGNYKWIKVPQYDMTAKQQNMFRHYEDLKKHHVEETTFLINKVRELAQQLKDTESEFITTSLPGLEGIQIIVSRPQLIKENESKARN